MSIVTDAWITSMLSQSERQASNKIELHSSMLADCDLASSRFGHIWAFAQPSMRWADGSTPLLSSVCMFANSGLVQDTHDSAILRSQTGACSHLAGPRTQRCSSTGQRAPAIRQAVIQASYAGQIQDHGDIIYLKESGLYLEGFPGHNGDLCPLDIREEPGFEGCLWLCLPSACKHACIADLWSADSYHGQRVAWAEQGQCHPLLAV